jgi:hypothetical protein
MLVDMEFGNNTVSNMTGAFHILQVIVLTIHWIQLRSFILPSDEPQIMVSGCNYLGITACIYLYRVASGKFSIKVALLLFFFKLHLASA